MKLSSDSLIARLVGEATRLTRSGHLADATAAIQRALARSGTAATSGPPTARRGAGASVLDGLVREVTGRPPRAERTADGTPAPVVGPSPGRFVGDVFSGEFGSRAHKLFVPSCAGAERRPLPLVVMLHGCTQDPDDFAAGTRMNELAERDGFLVLYPAQAPRSNSSKCWNWFQPGDQRRGRGEPALLAAMTRHVIATQAVDADRVHVAGLSAGGAMAAILGREYPDVFASVGVHSGLPQGAAHDVASAFAVMRGGQAAPAPAGGAPVIVVHGDQDKTVHPDNGERVIGAMDSGTVRATERGQAGRGFVRSVWRGADGRVRAEHWLVHGAGHAWSGGSPAGSFTDASGPDASAEMLRFFREHPRTVAR